MKGLSEGAEKKGAKSQGQTAAVGSAFISSLAPRKGLPDARSNTHIPHFSFPYISSPKSLPQ